MLCCNCLLSHGVTDITDDPCSMEDSSSADGFNVEWDGWWSTPQSAWDTQDSLLILRESALSYTLYLFPLVLDWKLLTSLNESFHVLEINSIPISRIFFSMQSMYSSFHFLESVFFSLVSFLNSTLLPTQIWGKWWKQQK